jgi:adenylylsulfate kinase
MSRRCVSAKAGLKLSPRLVAVCFVNYLPDAVAPPSGSQRGAVSLCMQAITKVFWLFGRSGAGKTTLALRLRDGMRDRNLPVVCLDGDEMRSTLCSDLGFKPDARLENHRRIAAMARLLSEQNLHVVVATMAPEYQHRDLVSRIVGEKLVWFYIHAPLEVCMARDPKGIYKRALAGEIQELINYPFAAPRPQENGNPINTFQQNADECYQAIWKVAQSHFNASSD